VRINWPCIVLLLGLGAIPLHAGMAVGSGTARGDYGGALLPLTATPSSVVQQDDQRELAGALPPDSIPLEDAAAPKVSRESTLRPGAGVTGTMPLALSLFLSFGALRAARSMKQLSFASLQELNATTLVVHDTGGETLYLVCVAPARDLTKPPPLAAPALPRRWMEVAWVPPSTAHIAPAIPRGPPLSPVC